MNETSPPGLSFAARPPRLTAALCQECHDEWGFNCGPGALCGVLNCTPAEIRRHLKDFEKKGFTNPTLMGEILRGLNLRYDEVFRCLERRPADLPALLAGVKWPDYGLVRIQWGGRWCNEGVPTTAAHRHTHWVAVRKLGPIVEIFDVNAEASTGHTAWTPLAWWSADLVPFILEGTKCDGDWWPTHVWSIDSAAAEKVQLTGRAKS